MRRTTWNDDLAGAGAPGSTAPPRDLDPPLAALDLDALDANADDLVRRAAGDADPGGQQVGAQPRGAAPGAGAGPASPACSATRCAEALWLAAATTR